jgi:hypothetical protein
VSADWYEEREKGVGGLVRGVRIIERSVCVQLRRMVTERSGCVQLRRMVTEGSVCVQLRRMVPIAAHGNREVRAHSRSEKEIR